MTEADFTVIFDYDDVLCNLQEGTDKYLVSIASELQKNKTDILVCSSQEWDTIQYRLEDAGLVLGEEAYIEDIGKNNSTFWNDVAVQRNLVKKKTLVIDDNPSNYKAALSVGYNAILWKYGSDSSRTELNIVLSRMGYRPR